MSDGAALYFVMRSKNELNLEPIARLVNHSGVEPRIMGMDL
jgi:hypothetical protein